MLTASLNKPRVYTIIKPWAFRKEIEMRSVRCSLHCDQIRTLVYLENPVNVKGYNTNGRKSQTDYITFVLPGTLILSW